MMPKTCIPRRTLRKWVSKIRKHVSNIVSDAQNCLALNETDRFASFNKRRAPCFNLKGV